MNARQRFLFVSAAVIAAAGCGDSTADGSGLGATSGGGGSSSATSGSSSSSGGGGGSPADVEADWQARIGGPGVVWYHDFKSDDEVNAFRWTGGYSGGNDPLAVGSREAPLVRRVA